MTKQSLQLSALTLVGSPTTSLRTQYSSALEPSNFFLLVADIYRRISFVTTKVISFLPLINLWYELQTDELRMDSKPAANIRLKEILKRRALFGNQTVVFLYSSKRTISFCKLTETYINSISASH